jgi:hypothetical protein
MEESGDDLLSTPCGSTDDDSDGKVFETIN